MFNWIKKKNKGWSKSTNHKSWGMPRNNICCHRWELKKKLEPGGDKASVGVVGVGISLRRWLLGGGVIKKNRQEESARTMRVFVGQWCWQEEEEAACEKLGGGVGGKKKTPTPFSFLTFPCIFSGKTHGCKFSCGAHLWEKYFPPPPQTFSKSNHQEFLESAAFFYFLSHSLNPHRTRAKNI